MRRKTFQIKIKNCQGVKLGSQVMKVKVPRARAMVLKLKLKLNELIAM